MKRTISAMLGAAMLIALGSCGAGQPAEQQSEAAQPTLSSITVNYTGSTDPDTTISDLSNMEVTGQYSDGATKTPEGCELLSPVTLKPGTSYLVTVVCGSVTGDTTVTGSGEAQ